MKKSIHFLNSYWILLLLIAVKLLLQFVLVNPIYELHRDEFLHLNQADHLAFGFISVPPFTALIPKKVEYAFAREKDTGIYLLTGGNSEVTERVYKEADERKEKLDIF